MCDAAQRQRAHHPAPGVCCFPHSLPAGPWSQTPSFSKGSGFYVPNWFGKRVLAPRAPGPDFLRVPTQDRGDSHGNPTPASHPGVLCVFDNSLLRPRSQNNRVLVNTADGGEGAGSGLMGSRTMSYKAGKAAPALPAQEEISGAPSVPQGT